MGNNEEGPYPFPSHDTVTCATSSILIRPSLLIELGNGFKEKGVGCILPLSANLDFARHGIPTSRTYFCYHHTSCIDQIFMLILLPSTQYQVGPPQPPKKGIIFKVHIIQEKILSSVVLSSRCLYAEKIIRVLVWQLFPLLRFEN